MKTQNQIVEKYYAIRIGTPGRHFPYFMIRRDKENAPWLFLTRSAAEDKCPKGARVVKVRVIHP